MTAAVLIYAMPHPVGPVPHIDVALTDLRPLARRLVLVVPDSEVANCAAYMADHEPFDIVPMPAEAGYSVGAAYRAGMLAHGLSADGAVILTGSHVAGPIAPIAPEILDPASGGAQMAAAYFHAPQLDPRLRGQTRLDRAAYLDFAVFAPDLLGAEWFRAFWNGFQPSANYWAEFMQMSIRLSEGLAEAGGKVSYPKGSETFETADPRQYEVDKVVRHGMPCLPLSVFTLDPLLHDLEGIDLRGALDPLRGRNPALYDAVIRFVTRQVPMRDFNTIADQYEILPETARDPAKGEWAFGRIAIFIHAFYAEMMPEFWALITRIPCAHDLFLTTSTEAHKAQIEAFLDDHGFPADRREVRVVEQNRGRDMSSLFITFRDVIMDGRYELALRLHSKRTPQVSRQVGEGFKKHLFDNLVKSPGYVSNVLDLFESQPDIGMVMPPVIHVGFGTLGHSWFNNRTTLAGLARDMGLNVPFDADTPVAPYGTMYWFRTEALAKMFEWEWRWEDYNPEPHHIDGGLAHVQERLIGYCVQDAGFRIVQAMNPELAARYYAKLEYKLQLLAARLMSGHIMLQRDQLDHLRNQGRAKLFNNMQGIYGRILRRFPASRNMLRPIAKLVVRSISPKPKA